MNKNNLSENQSNFLFYTSNDGEVNVGFFLKDKTIWLIQKAIVKLFGKSKSTINEHLTKRYADGELLMDPTIRNYRTVQTEGSRQVEQDLDFYNFDAIIAVGHRINSHKAIKIRILEKLWDSLLPKLISGEEYDLTWSRLYE